MIMATAMVLYEFRNSPLAQGVPLKSRYRALLAQQWARISLKCLRLTMSKYRSNLTFRCRRIPFLSAAELICFVCNENKQASVSLPCFLSCFYKNRRIYPSGRATCHGLRLTQQVQENACASTNHKRFA